MNIVWKDNFPTQYKCCQNFWKVASSGKAYKSSIFNKLAQKFRLKVPWDTAGIPRIFGCIWSAEVLWSVLGTYFYVCV